MGARGREHGTPPIEAAARAPYTAAEVAEKLGHCADWLYRNYDRLVREDFMPPRLMSRGQYAFHRVTFDAWLTRRTRQAILSNVAPREELRELATVEADRDLLAEAYGAH